ncbi:MAG: helix-turn-helix domain-containing protein, partial [Gammaproteobacteria bacterium]|nr:helix-turn-helix domain-containing protein [Gammaproteobacteria bacterium]
MSEMQTGALAPDSATPGRILAAARTERGMSVSEVAQRLKFSLRHIEALESDRYDVLPSGPFARGMVRTYARLLGVDAAPLLDALPKSGAGGEPVMQPKDMSVPFPQGPQSGSRVYLLLSMVIVVAVAVVLAEWFIRSQRDVPQESAVQAPGATPRPAGPLAGPAGPSIVAGGSVADFFTQVRRWYGHDRDAFGRSQIPAASRFDFGLSHATRQVAFTVQFGAPNLEDLLAGPEAPPDPRLADFFGLTGQRSDRVTFSGPRGAGGCPFCSGRRDVALHDFRGTA